MRNVKNLTLCVLMLALVSNAAGGTLYVPSYDYSSIQAAIDAAADGDEIEVAPGTYEEAIDFSGKAIRLYSSEGPGGTIIDGNGEDHVVQCISGEGAATILEGFTITGSGQSAEGGGMYNNGSSPTVNNCIFKDNKADFGGGMYNNTSSPTLTNCTFTGNGIESGVGGMYNHYSSPTLTNCTFTDNGIGIEEGLVGGMYNYYSSPTLTNCTFTGNSAHGTGGMCNCRSNPTVTDCTFSGNSAVGTGGMRNYEYSNPIVTNCIFSGNSSEFFGGGMYNCDSSNPEVMNCTFAGNHVDNEGGEGGGMRNHHSCPTVVNCVFTGNSAGYEGGGMCNYNDECAPTVVNCTFVGNVATGSGSMPHGGGMYSVGLCSIVSNCIFWSNYGSQLYGSPDVTYSNIEGGWTGAGNIDVDPLFKNSAGGDYHLDGGSPCIDAGNDLAVPPGVKTDLDGNPRIQGSCVDMGAFEAPTDPMEMLAGMALFIMDEVDAGNIDAELEGSLLDKVNAALAALDRGNPNDVKMAMNNLKALINQVEAQVDKKITPEAAAEIIQRANDIIMELGG